jgi:pyruvate dehydrogenase E1 component alpha subunit
VEYKTFRMALHFSGDPGGYVKLEDLDEWSKRDPIDLCQKKLFDRGYLTKEEDQTLREGVNSKNEKAVEYATSCADPTLDDLFTDVYAEQGVI